MKQSQLLLVGLLALVLLGGGGYLLMKGTTPAPSSTSLEISTTPEILNASGSSGAMVPPSEETAKIFTVTANNFVFDVKEMKVKQGDTVTIVFKNAEGFHDWVIDEFNARTKQLQAGQEETITFTADKTGTFEYYCSVGKHREMGMVGKLMVE